MDSVKEDLGEKGLVQDEFEDREREWHSLVRNADPV